MKRSDIAMGVSFALVGVLFFIVSLGLGINIRGPGRLPEAGFFPALLGVLLILFGIGISISGYLNRQKSDFFAMDEEQKVNIRPLIITPVLLLVFFVIWRLTVFDVGALVFCLAANHLYKRSWKFNILFSLLFVTLLHLIFITGLQIQFDM